MTRIPFASACLAAARDQRRQRLRLKRLLNTQAVEQMTAERLAERDPDHKPVGWLRRLGSHLPPVNPPTFQEKNYVAGDAVGPIHPAAFRGLYIETFETEEALREIRALCTAEAWTVATWDIDRGLGFQAKVRFPRPVIPWRRCGVCRRGLGRTTPRCWC